MMCPYAEDLALSAALKQDCAAVQERGDGATSMTLTENK